MVYIDSRDATPHCATCEGIVTTPPGFSAELDALIGDMRLALGCIGIFGGIPIPVKQDLIRKMSAVRNILGDNHLLHDLAHELKSTAAEEDLSVITEDQFNEANAEIQGALPRSSNGRIGYEAMKRIAVILRRLPKGNN